MGDVLADALATALTGAAGRRLPIDDVMGRLLSLRPELGTDADRYRQLAAILDSLAERGDIVLTKGRTVRHGTSLPTSVRVGGATPPIRVEDPARRFPWVPQMSWAAGGSRRRADVHENLVALSTWIARHPAPRSAPVRERSLEVLGDDKALGRMLTGVLAGHPETVAALAVEVVHPPMAVAEIEQAHGRTVLVVENGTTFHSVVRAARCHVAAGVPVAVRWVGFGVGRQLATLVPSLADLSPPPTAMAYFGDLDPAGLTIAAEGAHACAVAGLPPLRPATCLYGWLLDRGRPQPRSAHAWPAAGLDWLGAGLCQRVEAELKEAWLAREWVGVDVLRSDPTWCIRP